MKNESKKITLIINEILTLLLYHGAKDINIQITKNIDTTNINFTQNTCDLNKEFIDQLRFDLEAQRENEVEGYYWQLVGKDDLGGELHLVGAMIDESNVNLKDNVLSINIKRKCKIKCKD